MDIRNLSANHPKLITYMEGAGYSQRYIAIIQNEIQKIITSADK